MKNLPNQVKIFIETVQKSGFGCYVVGGCVRDLILERENHDWDFTTNATPEQIQKMFPDSFYNNSFGTVGVKVENDIFEITPYRTEGKYSDLRHPDTVVWAKTLNEDLARRDFTINAMATNDEKIIDLFNSQEDLKNKVIRCVGNASDRFNEDALRMLRAIRFATQLGFTIEENTFDAIKNNASSITNISGERIRDELVKIFKSDYPADGVTLLHSSGLLDLILPELTKGYGMKQPGHHIHDVFTHSVEALRHCKNENWVVRFATLIHDIGKPATYLEREGKPTFYNHEVTGSRIAKDVADRLHFGKVDRDKLFMLVRWHMFTVSEFLTDAAIRRFIKRVGPENTEDMLDLRIADRLGSGSKETSWRLEEFKERIIDVQKHTPSVNDLVVDGNNIMQILGIPPGPKIGEILKKLFEEILEDPTKNTREYLVEKIKRSS